MEKEVSKDGTGFVVAEGDRASPGRPLARPGQPPELGVEALARGCWKRGGRPAKHSAVPRQKTPHCASPDPQNPIGAFCLRKDEIAISSLLPSSMGCFHTPLPRSLAANQPGSRSHCVWKTAKTLTHNFPPLSTVYTVRRMSAGSQQFLGVILP